MYVALVAGRVWHVLPHANKSLHMYSICTLCVCKVCAYLHKSSSIKVLHTLSLLLQTWFVVEVGCDTGGVTRELWRLLAQDIMGLCDGVEGTLCSDMILLRSRYYILSGPELFFIIPLILKYFACRKVSSRRLAY